MTATKLIEALLSGEALPTDDEAAKVEALKSAAVAYFEEGGWKPRDLRALSSSMSRQDIWDHLNNLAYKVGRRKGYGDEGASNLHWEYMQEVSKRAGIPGAFDDI